MAKYQIEMTKDYNVEFRTAVNKHSVTFQLNSFRGLLYATIGVDGETVVAGEKVVRDVSLLPARYKNILGGIFYFGGNGVGYPDADSMDNITSTLIYETDE